MRFACFGSGFKRELSGQAQDQVTFQILCKPLQQWSSSNKGLNVTGNGVRKSGGIGLFKAEQ